MFAPEDRNISVNYYLVESGSALEATLQAYDAKCEAFVAATEALVEKHNADSAVRLHSIFGMTVNGLNFDYETAPLSWHMDGFGHFHPSYKHEDAPAFREELLYLSRFSGDIPDGFRYGTLGGQYVAAVTPNKDGSVSQVEGATVLTSDELETLKEDATTDELAHFTSLGRLYWEPQALSADVFKVSDEVRQLNQERSGWDNDWRTKFKHSKMGMRLHRTARNFGL